MNLLKILQPIAVFVLLSVVIYSCNDSNQEELEVVELQGEAYFEANVSIFDAKVRGLSATNYVKELYIVDFGSNPQSPAYVNFQGTQFADNGKGFDSISGDGVYTSLESFVNTKFTGLKEKEILSVLNAPMFNRELFTHLDALQKLEETYPFRDLDGAKIQIVECEASIEIGTNDCLAAQWGWCSDCCVTITVDLDNCVVGF